MEKDYIERTQKDAKDYYDKALASVSKFLDWLIIFIAAVPLIVGLFGFRTIDRIIEHAVTKASDQLDRKAAELKTLIDSNAAQMKQLEEDMMLRGAYAFDFNQGQIQERDQEYTAALACYRRAVDEYKRSKPRHLFGKTIGTQALEMTFSTIKKLNPTNFQEVAKNELANELYNDFEDELALAALELDWLGPLVKERKQAPPSHNTSGRPGNSAGITHAGARQRPTNEAAGREQIARTDSSQVLAQPVSV